MTRTTRTNFTLTLCASACFCILSTRAFAQDATATAAMAETQTAAPTPTATNTPNATQTANMALTQTAAPTPTSTPTNTPTQTPTSTPTNTKTPTNTATPTNTPTVTNTPAFTPVATVIAGGPNHLKWSTQTAAGSVVDTARVCVIAIVLEATSTTEITLADGNSVVWFGTKTMLNQDFGDHPACMTGPITFAGTGRVTVAWF